MPDEIEYDYVVRRYLEFYMKHGYLPKLFSPYNCSDIEDICVNLTCSCSSAGGTGGIAILEVNSEFLESHKELFRGFSDE